MSKKAKDDPGLFEFPGGHIEPGETPLLAAIREWCEETGLNLPDGDLTGRWESTDGVYHGFVITIPSEDSLPILGDRDDVSNPDTNGRVTEPLTWWDPDLLEDNPAIRQEILDDLGTILDALKTNYDGPLEKAASGYSLGTRSGMVSLDLPEDTVEPVPGGVKDFHVTVVFLGQDIDDAAFENACARAQAAAASADGPLAARLSGIAAFPASDSSDGKIPVYVPAEIPGADSLRNDLSDLSASEYLAWVPHVTLAYLDENDPMPDPLPPTVATFTHLSVHRGDDVCRFELGTGNEDTDVASKGFTAGNLGLPGTVSGLAPYDLAGQSSPSAAAPRAGREKLPKEEVNYQPSRSLERRCGTCVMYDHHSCTLVAGDIDPDDVCDRWESRRHDRAY